MIRMLENVVVKRFAGALVLGAFLLAGAVPAYAEKQQEGNRPPVDRMVEKALRDGRDIPVIVRYKDAAAGERLERQSSGRRELRRHLRQSRTLSLKLNHRALRELLESGDVESVSYDAPVKSQQLDGLSEPAPVSVDASASKAARYRYSVSGWGVSVAVIDSGVRPHADLPSTRIKAFVDFVNGATSPYDDYGHGTHVAGIIAGNGSSSGGQYTGVAPGAGIVALKVLDHTGAGRTSDVMAALEWVLANRTTYNIRIVNLSLGHPIYEPAATDPMVQLVEQLTRQGLVIVVSAGNLGRNSLGQTVYGSITSPANAQGAIAVGAVDTMGTKARGDDTVAPFSSRGPTRFDYYVKPDVVAPGYRIASLVSPNSTLAVKYPNLIVNSSYFRLNGTSQAAPVVAGAAALMLHANASLTSHTVKGIVQFTAQRMKNLDVMTQGAGEVNVAGAVRLAKLIQTTALEGRRWLKGRRNPIQADLLYGETTYWGKVVIWGTTIKPSTRALYMHVAQWDDNIVWGYMDDNIVWSMDDNIVWSMTDDNIVWSMDDENLIWGFTDDNIVWGFDDNIVWSMDDNIVWSMDDNIVWSMTDESVLAFSETLIGMSYEEGGQK